MPLSQEILESRNPFDGSPLAIYSPMSDGDVDAVLTRMAAAFAGWRRSSWSERSGMLLAIAGRLRAESAVLADVMALEMGKPLAQGEAEVEKCATACEYYAHHGEALLPDEPAPPVIPGRATIVYEPLGIVLGIMPWNYPLWQVFRCLAPIVAAGNGFALKHAPNVTGCARKIEELIRDAGAPPDLVRTLPVTVDQVPRIIEDRRIAGVTLTGSEAAGRAVAALAGQSLKPATFELGGSDAFLVLEDADLDVAAEAGAASRLQNAGQSCIAAKRFIVVREVFEPFLERFLARMEAVRPGDPRGRATAMGPLALERIRTALHAQAVASVAMGARVLLGARVVEGAGWSYPATVLDRVGPGMPVWDEETFGPVAAVASAAGEEQAIDLANATRFGLGASVWTRDPATASRVVRRLECGMTFVNHMVRSDPRAPFGGIKCSGYGRELGRHGMQAFANVKTVWTAS